MNPLKAILFAGLFAAGCAAQKASVLADPALISALARPVKIFAIGYWGRDAMVLTLVDARHQYQTIIIRRDERLKRGEVYQP